MIKNLIKNKKRLIFIQVHDPISAIVVKKTFYKKNKNVISFDGLWLSSLADSFIKGIPDEEILSLNERIKNAFDIRSVTDLPIIIDADTGGNLKNFIYYIKMMQQVGINAVVIEDKRGVKKNSLFGIKKKQILEDIDVFCHKIYKGKKYVYDKNFFLIARMEGLIAGLSIQETFERSLKSIEAGADAILIHSIKNTAKQIIDFSKIYKSEISHIPLICIPTTYSDIKYTELNRAGIDIIIYANHLVRSSYKAMEEVARLILKNKRTYEIENKCISIKKILNISK